MEIKINIKKEYLMILVGLLGIAFAVAYGGNNPRELGHSAGEVEIVVNGTPITLQQAVDTGQLGGHITLRQTNGTCTWVGGQRCRQCRLNWICPEGTYAAGVGQASTGETSVDYVLVYCCAV